MKERNKFYDIKMFLLLIVAIELIYGLTLIGLNHTLASITCLLLIAIRGFNFLNNLLGKNYPKIHKAWRCLND